MTPLGELVTFQIVVSLADDSRCVIYEHDMFIVQVTAFSSKETLSNESKRDKTSCVSWQGDNFTLNLKAHFKNLLK